MIYSLLININFYEIAPGFILCDAQQEPCGVGRVFDAQVNNKTNLLLLYSNNLGRHNRT
jgi:hypothetical protein